MTAESRKGRSLSATAHRRGALLSLLLVVGLAACAAPLADQGMPVPEEIPTLEAYLESYPTSVATLVRLGVAYRQAQRLDEAVHALERAVELQATDPGAVFYLGLVYEDLDRPGDARGLYVQYLTVGRDQTAIRAIRSRLPLLERQEFARAVRESLATEAQLAATSPTPRSVAVFPFLYAGGDPQLRPLSRALAEMLTTDLSHTNRLTVVERARVQFLLDEIQLGGSGLVDQASAVRGGRLLGAERIVQGRIEGDELQMRLQAVVVGLGGEWDGTPRVEQASPRELFDMQKRLALSLYESLGVQLTPAERERVTRRATENIEAVLAYGQCLEAEDSGDFAAAAALCASASAIDPGFEAARLRGERASEAAVAAQVDTNQLAALGAGEVGSVYGASLDAIRVLVPAGPNRNAASEALGYEGIESGSTIVEIIIRRP